MKRNLFIPILALAVFLVPNSALAARVSFQPSEHLSRQEAPFTTTIVLDTADDNINTVEGMIKIDPRLIKGLQVSDSGSIVTYWINRPVVDEAKSIVRFAGAIPGGYNGTSGILFSLIFKPYSGEAIDSAAAVSQFNAYKNDGLASAAQITSSTFNLGDIAGQIDEGIASQLYLNPNRQDNIPPEVFSPRIFQEESIEDGRWLIAFETTDKQSGIDHYEIQESLTGSMDSGRWRIATSPYVLEDQELHSFIYVIAVDRQGNERIIKVFPRVPLPWYRLYRTELLGISILAAAVVVLYYHRRQRALNRTHKNKNV